MSKTTTAAEKIVVALVTSIGVICLMAGLGMLLAFPIKWTWNATMPYLFSLPVLTWGKAWCLNFLCGVLINRGRFATPSK